MGKVFAWIKTAQLLFSTTINYKNSSQAGIDGNTGNKIWSFDTHVSWLFHQKLTLEELEIYL